MPPVDLSGREHKKIDIHIAILAQTNNIWVNIQGTASVKHYITVISKSEKVILSAMLNSLLLTSELKLNMHKKCIPVFYCLKLAYL